MDSVKAIELIVQEFGRQAKNEKQFLLGNGLDAVNDAVAQLILDPVNNDGAHMTEAAVRVAATAFRFLVDVC